MSTNNVIKNNQTQLGPKITGNSDGSFSFKNRGIALTDYTSGEYINQSDEINSNYITLAAGNVDSQTITPSVTAKVTAMSIYVYSGSLGYLDIYFVNPVTSTPIVYGYIQITSGMSGWQKITFFMPGMVVAGVQYQVFLYSESGGGSIKLGYDATGSYPGGNMTSNPSWDYMFRFHMENTGWAQFPSQTIRDVIQTYSPSYPDLYYSYADLVLSARGSYLLSFDLVDGAKPFFSTQTSNVTSTWWGLGYFMSSESSRWIMVTEAVIQNYNTGEICRAELFTSWLGGNDTLTKYRIISGNLSSVRPLFRTYYYSPPVGPLLFIYAKIPANCNITFSNYLYDLYNNNFANNYVVRACTYEGTGTDPNSATGKTLKYDTSVDDAGYYAAKTVTATASFWGTSPTFSLSFSVSDNKIIVNFDKLQQNASTTAASVISTAPGAIPSKWCPSNTVTRFIAGFDTGIWAIHWVRVFTDGSIIVTKCTAFTILNSNITGVINNSYGWESFSMDWVLKTS